MLCILSLGLRFIAHKVYYKLSKYQNYLLSQLFTATGRHLVFYSINNTSIIAPYKMNSNIELAVLNNLKSYLIEDSQHWYVTWDTATLYYSCFPWIYLRFHNLPNCFV